MFNTKMDDYSVVGSQCPFKRDAYGLVADAFRKRGLGVGAYYCKVDWHRPDYWDPSVFAETSYANYDTMANETKWNSYVQFLAGQLNEISTQYNPDIMWLDGGWLRPVREDMRLDLVAEKARKVNPNVLIVNRGGGYFEDYTTPEFLTQSPGENPLPQGDLRKPWESCMSLGTQWGYIKNDQYKSVRQILDLLTSIVANGGNLLLDIGPGPDGTLPEQAMDRLKGLAAWMKVNQEAIHNTEPIFPYNMYIETSNHSSQVIKFTRNQRVIYIISMLPDGQNTLPARIWVPCALTDSFGDLDDYHVGNVELLGSTVKLTHYYEKGYLHIDIPAGTQSPAKDAYVLKVSE